MSLANKAVPLVDIHPPDRAGLEESFRRLVNGKGALCYGEPLCFNNIQKSPPSFPSTVDPTTGTPMFGTILQLLFDPLVLAVSPNRRNSFFSFFTGPPGL